MHIELACELPHEAPRLHAAISDFSSDGPRADYADWLDAEGASGRATLVRATIDAFNSLDVADLDSASASVWKSMIGIPELSALAGCANGNDDKAVRTLRDFALPLLRPMVSLEPDLATENIPVGESHFWGNPDLPGSETWPLVAECSDWYGAKQRLPASECCALVAQLAYRDFSATVLAHELPSSGGLSVFTFVEFESLGVTETVLRPWDVEAALVRTEPPESTATQANWENLAFPMHTIKGTETLSLPNFTDGPHSGRARALGLDRDLVEWLDTDLTRGLGGYMRSSMTGGDSSTDDASGQLVSLRTRPSGGGLYFTIPVDDLDSGRLDRAEYVWADWD